MAQIGKLCGLQLYRKNNMKRIFSKETRLKMSLSRKGKVPWNKGKKGVQKGYWAGKKRPEISGENNYQWIEDRTLIKKYIDSAERNSQAVRRWRSKVWKRDNYKCRIADNNCNGKIEAHHILSWRDFVELRYEVNNGITLCHAHHPRARAEEKRLIPTFQELVSVSSN